MENNRTRIITRVIEEFCKNSGIELTPLSHDWIFLLRKGDLSKVVFGYDVGANSSTVLSTVRDKAATYDVLSKLGLPAIRHEMFLAPRFLRHIDRDGNWQAMLDSHRRNANRSVVKANEGTGGIDVYFVESVAALEQAVHLILAQERSVALSPHEQIDREIRAYVSYGEVLKIYEKILPAIVGDGKRPLWELCVDQLGPEYLAALSEVPSGQIKDSVFLAVPGDGENRTLGWKHNLGQGSTIRHMDPTLSKVETELALQVANSIGLNFGSIDMVEIDNELKVLEINNGVMLENAYYSDEIEFDEIKRIYESALNRLFE